MENFQKYIVLFLLIIFVLTLLSNRFGFRNFIKNKSYKDWFSVVPVIVTTFWIIIILVFAINKKIFEMYGVYEASVFANKYFLLFGIVIFLVGIWYIYNSYKKLGKNLNIGANVSEEQSLVVDGVYKISRNPIYLGFYLVYLGVFFVIANWIFFIYFVFIVLFLNILANKEEQVLSKKYKHSYIKYKKRVKKYF